VSTPLSSSFQVARIEIGALPGGVTNHSGTQTVYACVTAMRFAPTRFPAPIVRAKTIGGLRMSETSYEGLSVLPTHSHEYACLVVVIAGTFEDHCGRVERAAIPGMVILRPAGEPHSNSFRRARSRVLNVEVPPPWQTRIREYTSVLDRPAAFTGGTFSLMGFRLYQELRNEDAVSSLAVESIVLGLLAGAERASRRSTTAAPPWLIRSKEVIENRASDPLTLAVIAAEVGVHPVHLASAFQRFYGLSVGEFLRQTRIAQACRRLTETNCSLTEIAILCGFSDQSHFGRTFKRVMNVTPRQFRVTSR
jgi:AraC family transcriptional regulator